MDKIWKTSIDNLEKYGEFLPSLFPAPDNHWTPDSDEEIALNPDAVDDDTDLYGEWWQDKPRNSNMWKEFISMFKQPFSKKEEMTIQSSDNKFVTVGRFQDTDIIVPEELLNKYISTISAHYKGLNKQEAYEMDLERSYLHKQLINYVLKNIFSAEGISQEYDKDLSFSIDQLISNFAEDVAHQENLPKESAYDPEMDEKEKEELGLDETQLEYSKNFYDPKKHDFPYNTTWDSPQKMPNQHEPYSPLPVTLDMVQNPKNNDQNSPGGFPGRFCQPPKSEWFSDEGEIVPALQNMWKNRKASLNNTGYFISPEGEVFELEGEEGHFDFVRQMYKTKDLQPEVQMQEMLSNGWTRVREGDYDVNVEVADITHIPPHVEEFLQAYPDDTVIIIESNQLSQNVTLEKSDLDIGLQKAINKALSQKRMAKQAGSYSSTYTDEQGNDFKNEQLYDGIDDVQYVDKNNRDYPFGMRDMNDSSTDYPKPEDIEPYVVRLDILENPSYRLDPFGIGEYNVTWYESLPASDGIEKGNPE